MSFPKNFIWGTATSSYQIEGAVTEDGKGRSIWDDFTRVPGKILDGSSGDVACDHYHRFREDVKLMAEMGIKNYRFSICWPRVLPEGTGRVNPAGIQFYSDLVDCLLAHGIRPFVTLFHWDLPSALHHKGAWLNDEMPEWFAEYTRVVAQALGDRVKDYFTINEAQCVIGSSYVSCELAPGIPHTTPDIIRMTHNLLKAHGRAVQVLREVVPDAKVGYAPCGSVAVPATDSPEDVEAARQQYFGVPDASTAIGWNISWFSDPVCLGRYPEEGLRHYGQYLPDGWEQDMALIAQPLDFYAQNIYQGQLYRAGANGPEPVPFPVGQPRTAIGWPVIPDCLYWGVKFLYERYKLPILITENGMSCHDTVSLDGQVHDPNRIDFIHRYLLALKKAIDEGAEVQGYFYWSFWDNFEWAKGYQERFGLVHVNYQTQERIPKDSCRWYKTVMETNGGNL